MIDACEEHDFVDGCQARRKDLSREAMLLVVSLS